MDIGIGLPNTVPGATGASLLDWARRADRAGFSSLATIGALDYPGYEELTLFAAAGAVTERIRFMSNVLIAPLRSAAELAKQAASVDQLTGGRLTLGLSIGWRASDYALAERDYRSRGRRFDAQLRDLRAALDGEPFDGGSRPVVPPSVQAPIPIVIGGTSDAAVRRVVEFGAGWSAGGAPIEATKAMIDRVRTAWQRAGRDGEPRFVALAYFGLGDTLERSRAYLLDYYAPMGDMAAVVADGALRSPEAIRDALAAFADVGIHEVILDPTVADPDQVDRLADVVL
ncbi:LLM class flavin-dependent oxidoreductase [Egicoccus sp. AB-alg2]|uniref:LLM class flavin-dependent oxidoreductase n=1 Tax=Egicoccus sp. AB-alg2 TaxID=3242693 RepID=UPI00359E3EF0